MCYNPLKGERKEDSMNRKEIFHKNLRKLIDNSGKSQAEIADAIGEKYTTFNMWVVPNGTMPRADKLQKIADYFHVRLDELMSEDYDPHNKSILDTTIDTVRELSPLLLERLQKYLEFLKYEEETKNEVTDSNEATFREMASLSPNKG